MSSAGNSKTARVFLQKHKKALIEFTKQVCKIPTENPPGNHFEACVDLLKRYAEQAGLSTRKIKVPLTYQKQNAPEETWQLPRFNLICRWDTGSKKTLHFNSHYDVVPATAGWKSNPFELVNRQGKLYGRGTMDMKGCLASSFFAMLALKESGITPPWNIEFSFTCDEEIGGECGSGFIVRKGLISPDAVVVCEGGMGDTITYGHRGVLWLDIQIEGKAGHGSNPASGINAFEHGVRIANRLIDLAKGYKYQKTRHQTLGRAFQHPTMTVGGVAEGGEKVNIIPDRFHFTIDRRMLPEEDLKTVRNQLETLVRREVKKVKGLSVTIEQLTGYNTALTDPRDPLCLTAKKAVKEVLGKPGKLKLFGAFTDFHFFRNGLDCPTIGYGVEGEGLHSSHEYMVTQSLIDTANVYAEIMMRME